MGITEATKCLFGFHWWCGAGPRNGGAVGHWWECGHCHIRKFITPSSNKSTAETPKDTQA